MVYVYGNGRIGTLEDDDLVKLRRLVRNHSMYTDSH
jgi:hypothetical protein